MPVLVHSSKFKAQSPTAAFTLLEIMIVVGIMGIIMTTGVPIVYRAWKKAPMTNALTEVQDVCARARAEAIMQGKQVDLMFYPRDRRFAVLGLASGSASSSARIPLATPGTGGGASGQLPPEIVIDMLDINKLPRDFRDDEAARVRFFPNGTCDELTLILRSDRGEQRGVVLEVTTALASVLNEADLQLLREGSQ